MSLTLDDLRFARDPAGIAKLYHLLGYNAELEPVANSPEEARLEGAAQTDVNHVYLLVENPNFQAVHLECQGTLNTALIRRVAENFLKRPGYYLLSFRGSEDTRTIFVKPSHSDSRVKITRLTLNPQQPSQRQHEYSVLKEIALTGTPSDLEIHQRQVKAFDVERVTKKFFETYRELFVRLREEIKTQNPNTRIGMLLKNTTADRDSLHAFTQRLLGRMLFLYFIQKKGWLNSSQEWGDGQQDFIISLYKNRVTSDSTNFYRDILEPLFFETLNTQRQKHHSQFGRIPYLNGSLFEREYPETTVLNLPNALFNPSNPNSILGVLERFNFTIEESSSLEQDVSLDPEMLGKVFENLMEADEAAASGTFYTPRSIVQFLAEESLSRYLADSTGIELAKIRTLTADDDKYGDDDAEYGKLEIAEANKIIKALGMVRVLDPAVGTASMLVGMLAVMIRIRRSAEARLDSSPSPSSPKVFEWKKKYINDCLYGVDIKQEAIEIGRLRLWLSLVVDAREPEPLPNLDYKLMAGDGVLETLDGTRFGDTQTGTDALLGADVGIGALVKQIEQTRDAFFSEENPLERRKKRETLMQLERQLFAADVDWRVKNLDAQITVLRRRAHSKKGDSAKDLTLTTQLNNLVSQKNKVLRDLEPLPFFLHRVHFSDVMQRENAGFDIVLGNPPYVSIINMESSYKTALKTAFPEVESGRADLYVYFFAKAHELLRQNGRVAFITPNKFLQSDYAVSLRSFMIEKFDINIIINIGNIPIFDAITAPAITILRKDNSNLQNSFLSLSENTICELFSENLNDKINDFSAIVHENFSVMNKTELSSDGWNILGKNELNLIKKLKNLGVPLKLFIQDKICSGIKTGLNSAFIVDEVNDDENLLKNYIGIEIIKPIVFGKDIGRWKVRFSKKYIILTGKNTNLDKYPLVKKRLERFRKKLEKRSTAHLHKWFELQQPQENFHSVFEGKKIIYPDMSPEPRFVEVDDSLYIDMTVFAIPSPNKWLCKVLNSKVFHFLLMTNSPRLESGSYRFKATYMRNLPIVQPNPQQQALLESITDDSRMAELNAVVYQMYGLTPEEIALVESHTAKAGGVAEEAMLEDE